MFGYDNTTLHFPVPVALVETMDSEKDAPLSYRTICNLSSPALL
jgi:hypothetical protein